MIDALGNEIQIGKKYGVAVSHNGLTNITVGFADKITEKGNVTLRTLKESSGHDTFLKEYRPVPKRNIWVKCFHLFPVEHAYFKEGVPSMTVEEAIQGLNYQSESDAAWQTFKIVKVSALDCGHLKSGLRKPPMLACTQMDLDDFFDQLASQPQSDQYDQLKMALSDNYTKLQVFKLASTGTGYNLEIYIAGIDKNKQIGGVWVYATET